jgi:amidase
MDEITWLDATAQAELVRSGSVTSGELIEAALTRIASLNPQLNAVIHDRGERALAESYHAPEGPFHGVPLLLKDAVAHSAGDPYHFGMRALQQAGWVEADDTWLVARLRQAGFAIVGRTNTPELAASVTTEPLAYGPTRNPYDRERSPGGSSGGSAAAVASGMVPVAHGNDMGGSIRIPAAMCGLVGLKPTRARVTLGPELGEHWAMLTHEHVLTRSVRDTAAVLDAISGPGVGDPYYAPPPARPFIAEVEAEPGVLRIGVRTTAPGGEPVTSQDARVAVEATARQLETLGHHVELAEVAGLDDPRLAETIPIVLANVLAREVDRLGERLGRPVDLELLEPLNAARVEQGRATAAPTYLRAVTTLQHWSRGVASWWQDSNDVLLTPTIAAPTPLIGFLGPAVPDVRSRIRPFTAFTAPFNVTGQPAISLPLHVGPDGLPVGVQLVARYGREDVLLRLAGQLERAHPWDARRPALSGG